MKTKLLTSLVLVLGLALTGCAANSTTTAPSSSESASTTPTPAPTETTQARVVPTFDMREGGSVSLLDLPADTYDVDLQVAEGTGFEITGTSGFYFESYSGDATRQDGVVTVAPRDLVGVSTDLAFAWDSSEQPPEGAPHKIVFHLVFDGDDR